MALYSSDIQEFSSGFDKEIDESSRDLIMDLVQVNQYQYPVKSAIREIVSNSVDAIKERDVARLILTGAAKEEDYFIKRNDPKYKDSNFDPSYYDLNWLGTDQRVQIIYEERNLDKDRIRILDQGTGLGGKRLEGYFRLGYSTKRNSKLPLGKFGIGAKAGLSTGVDYYSVISRYNGMEFHFNVYAHKIDSTVPSLNLNTGKDNPSITMANGYTAFWLPIEKPNGTEVQLDVKKHRKQEYIDAVKSQLLYFENIEFNLKKATGYTEIIETEAKILYEDDLLIVSNNTQYSRPHLVINRVNYGYIDWKELELEEKLGGVGIKVSQEEVSINPSRESVVWNDKTKATIIDRFHAAKKVATEIVQKQLQDKDLFKWLKAFLFMRKTYIAGDVQDVVGRLSGIVDLRNLEPEFTGEHGIYPRMESLFPGMKLQFISLLESTKGGIERKKTERTDIKYIHAMDPSKPLYATSGRVSPKLVQYVLSQNLGGYYLLRYPENALAIEGADTEDDDSIWISAFDLHKIAVQIKEDDKTGHLVGTTWQEIADSWARQRAKVTKHIKASTVPIRLETITVPDDFEWNEVLELEDDSASQKQSTAEQRRILDERVLLYTPRHHPQHLKRTDGKELQVQYTWQKVEPRYKEVLNFQGKDIYYGVYDKDEAMLSLAAGITRPKKDWDHSIWINHSKLQIKTPGLTYTPKLEDWAELGIISVAPAIQSHYINHWWNTPVILFRMSQGTEKKYKMYKHISKFFMREEAGTITMSEKLINWYTGLLIDRELKGMEYLLNFKQFNTQKFNQYAELVKYRNEHFRDIFKIPTYLGFETAALEELLVYLGTVRDFQLLVRKTDPSDPRDASTVAHFSAEMFEGNIYKNGIAVDPAMYDLLQEVLEYSAPVKTLLSSVYPLAIGDTRIIDPAHGRFKDIPPDLEAEIQAYLNFKGLA